MKNYTMQRQMGVAQIAVDAVTKYLMTLPDIVQVHSVESDRSYQRQGMDLMVYTPDRVFSVEVKADTYYHTGNFFLETVSNFEKKTDGCFVSSQAEWLAYYFVGVNVLYMIPLKAAQKWFADNRERFKVRYTSTGNKRGEHYYKTMGYLVPRDILAHEVSNVRIVQL